MPLRLGTRLRSLRFQPAIGSVGLQLPRLDAVVQKTRKHFVDDLIAQRWVLNGERQLDAPEKISRHPIRAGKEHSRLSGILKIKNPAVFEKATDNADDPDIVAQTGHFWSQATDAPDNQIDGYLCTRSFIQFLDDFLID